MNDFATVNVVRVTLILAAGAIDFAADAFNFTFEGFTGIRGEISTKIEPDLEEWWESLAHEFSELGLVG